MTTRVPSTSRTQNCMVVAPGTPAFPPPLAGAHNDSQTLSSHPAAAGSMVSEISNRLPACPSMVTSDTAVDENPTMLVSAVTRSSTVEPIGGSIGPEDG